MAHVYILGVVVHVYIYGVVHVYTMCIQQPLARSPLQGKPFSVPPYHPNLNRDRTHRSLNVARSLASMTGLRQQVLV